MYDSYAIVKYKDMRAVLKPIIENTQVFVFIVLICSVRSYAADKLDMAKKILINSGLSRPNAFEKIDSPENLYNKVLLNRFSERMTEKDLIYLDKVFSSSIGASFKEALIKAQTDATKEMSAHAQKK